MKTKKQKITLEDIAVEIKSQKSTLKDIATQIQGIDNKLTNEISELREIVVEGFGIVTAKSEFNEFRQEVKGRFDSLDAQVGPQGRRLDHIEDDVRKINTRIGLNKIQ